MGPRAYSMKQRRAAAPYAKALFALAKERNQTELIGRELGGVAATFESDRDLRDFFARPWVPATCAHSVRRRGLWLSSVSATS